MRINKDRCELYMVLAWSITSAVVADVQEGQVIQRGSKPQPLCTNTKKKGRAQDKAQANRRKWDWEEQTYPGSFLPLYGCLIMLPPVANRGPTHCAVS